MKMEQIYAGLIDGTLVPRYHAGVGMMQLYLTETVRLHVFHPELPAKLEAFGNRHNHRFDLRSSVLLGAIVDIPLILEPSFYFGKYKLYNVTPAHLYDGSQKPELANENSFDIRLGEIRRSNAGQYYEMKKWEYHETRAEGLTITLMTKKNQEEGHARIIGHKEQRIGHAMEETPDQILVNQLFFSALRKLPLWAIECIENETEK